jgi:hypothetical protein
MPRWRHMVMEALRDIRRVHWTRDRRLVVYCLLRDRRKAAGGTLIEIFLADLRHWRRLGEVEEHRRKPDAVVARLRGLCGRQGRRPQQTSLQMPTRECSHRLPWRRFFLAGGSGRQSKELMQSIRSRGEEILRLTAFGPQHHGIQLDCPTR